MSGTEEDRREMEMFAAGFVLSLSACLDLGVVNVATIRRGLESGAAAAFALSVGSSFGDLFYAALSMVGLAVLLADPRVHVAFWLGGTVVLLYLSAATIRELRSGRTIEPASADRAATARRTRRSDFLRGLALALSSPSLIVWFASVGGSVIAGIYARTQSPPLLFLAGFFAAGICWGVLLSVVTGRGRHAFGTGAVRACSAASALLFLVLAAKVFVDGLSSVA